MKKFRRNLWGGEECNLGGLGAQYCEAVVQPHELGFCSCVKLVVGLH